VSTESGTRGSLGGCSIRTNAHLEQHVQYVEWDLLLLTKLEQRPNVILALFLRLRLNTTCKKQMSIVRGENIGS
jgi:hypothetical protein